MLVRKLTLAQTLDTIRENIIQINYCTFYCEDNIYKVLNSTELNDITKTELKMYPEKIPAKFLVNIAQALNIDIYENRNNKKLLVEISKKYSIEDAIDNALRNVEYRHKLIVPENWKLIGQANRYYILLISGERDIPRLTSLDKEK